MSLSLSLFCRSGGDEKIGYKRREEKISEEATIIAIRGFGCEERNRGGNRWTEGNALFPSGG